MESTSDGRRRAAAVDEGIDFEVVQGVGVAGVRNGGGAVRAGEFEPSWLDLGDHDLSRPLGAGHGSGKQADRSGAGDQHRAAGRRLSFVVGPHANRERLDQSGGVVGHRVGHGMDEVGRHGDVLRERAVDRRGAEERDVRAEVVAAVPAVDASSARHAGLDGHPLPYAVVRHIFADRHHDAAGLVAEDQWRCHDEVPDPAVLVVVHIGPAHAHRGDLDEHVRGTDLGDGALFDDDVADTPQHADLHR